MKKDTEKTESTEMNENTEGTMCSNDAVDTEAAKGEENAEEVNGGTEGNEDKEESLEDRLALAEARIAELEKERLYKQAEFDNYRKRIIKEKAELILNGGRKVLEAMLPIIDDLERALAHMGDTEDKEKGGDGKSTSTGSENAVREGVDLIYKKFLKVMETQGVTQMKTEGVDFNTDFHEAVTQFPAPSDDLKGKVIDCTEKGYMLNDTVLRFAKVVVGI